MGGNSSKTHGRRKPIPGAHSLEDITVTENSTSSKSALVTPANKENRTKTKKSKKTTVKIAKEATKRKAEKSSKSPQNVGNSLVVVEDSSEPQSPVYRKKSSCPSCDARDVQNACGRERKFSEKSLRYSDFNKVQRKTRIYDWELRPVDIPLYGVAEPSPEDNCYVCGVYTGRLLRTCRVCFRSFHDGCLAKIGHGLTDAARALLDANLWSCHQCVSLNHLLTQEEVKSVLMTFENLGLSTETITESQYLSYCQASLQQMGKKEFSQVMQEACVSRYRQVDRTHSGSITWTQLLNLESTRILRHRCKDSLVRLLTQAELSEARRMFQKLDLEKTGFITKRNLCVLLGSGNRERGSGYYPDETNMYSHDDLDSLVSWGEFLRDRVIYILAQRPNLRLPGNKEEDDLIEDGAMTPSFESIDDGDEPFHPENNGKVEERQTDRKVSHQCSSNDQLSSLDISTSILDDLTTELDKRCSQNAEEMKRLEGGASPQTELSTEGLGVQEASKKSEESRVGSEAVCGHGDSQSAPVAVTKASTAETRASAMLEKGGQQGTAPRRRSGVSNMTSAFRKSEVIPKGEPLVVNDGSKSMRQTRCKSMQVAPVYGGLVGKNLRTTEWNC